MNTFKKKYEKYFLTIIAILITIILLLPVYFMITYAFEKLEDMFHIPPYLIPPIPTLEPLMETLIGLSGHMVSSIIYATGVLLLTLVISPPAAYALAHFDMRINKYFTLVLIFSQMLPVVMLAIPLFLIFNKVGLINTYFGMILADATYTIPFCTLILSAFMRSVPFELVEAAYLDGATPFAAFIKVVLPISKSGLATIAIFAFLFPWADFIFGLTISVQNKMQPMSVGLYKYMELYGLRWNNLMAGGFIFAIPALIVVILAGRFIIGGLTAGALKQ